MYLLIFFVSLQLTSTRSSLSTTVSLTCQLRIDHFHHRRFLHSHRCYRLGFLVIIIAVIFVVGVFPTNLARQNLVQSLCRTHVVGFFIQRKDYTTHQTSLDFALETKEMDHHLRRAPYSHHHGFCVSVSLNVYFYSCNQIFKTDCVIIINLLIFFLSRFSKR